MFIRLSGDSDGGDDGEVLNSEGLGLIDFMKNK